MGDPADKGAKATVPTEFDEKKFQELMAQVDAMAKQHGVDGPGGTKDANEATAPAAERPKAAATSARPEPMKPEKAPEEPPAPRPRRRFWKMREQPSVLERALAAALFLAILGGVWVFLTRGKAEARVIPPGVLGSPEEVFGSFYELWYGRALMRNLLLSLWRVLQGFGLAVAVGVPVGVLCGTWPRINAFIAPLSVFGRNVPISTLVPLTLMWFGMDELQKVMFIFVACVMFVVFDSARAIASVDERYVHTALTLGARPHQVVFKVLVPLALPEIFGSLRLLFGVAFGYIVLAEMVNVSGGIGALILNSQRIGPREHVYLSLLAITLVAYGLDRVLLLIQRELFPHREVEE